MACWASAPLETARARAGRRTVLGVALARRGARRWRRREFSRVPQSVEDNRLNYGDAAPSPVSELMVVRDELKLSLPIGYALHIGSAAVIFGVLPEWSLDASIDD